MLGQLPDGVSLVVRELPHPLVINAYRFAELDRHLAAKSVTMNVIQSAGNDGHFDLATSRDGQGDSGSAGLQLR